MDSAQQQPMNIAPSEEECKEKEVGDGFGCNLDCAEDVRDVEEEEEGESNQVGDGFGGNLDGTNQDARDVNSQCDLERLRIDIDMNAQIQLLRAIGDYYERNGRYPYFDRDTLQGFMTNELQIFDVAPEVFNVKIETLRSIYTQLRMIVNADGAGCLVDSEVLLVRLGDKIFWNIKSNDLPSNSEVGDGFGGNLDGADDASDDEEEEGENNQASDGFGGNLDGANQDASNDPVEDFRDDPNFSIDEEELLLKWEEERRREM